MPESDMAKRITMVVKAIDKLVRDLVKDAERLREAARKLRGEEKNEPD